MTHRLPVLAALGLALMLSACSTGPVEPVASPQPAFYQRLDEPGRQLDPASSLSMINQYRGNKGVPPLVWDPAIAAVAQDAADRMAAENRVIDERELGLPARMTAAGVSAKGLAVNLTGGYRTFAEAFSGWREAKAQNAHMLTPGQGRIGLATAYRPASKYQVFWVLIVAGPA